jgi:hypothetical protein
MKKSMFSAFAVGLCLTASVWAQVPSYVPTNGLAGWWPFNANANDESGNGNNGTVNGATLTTDRFGNTNKAYDFDGLNDFIQVSSLSLNNLSISAWINLDSTLSSGGLSGIASTLMGPFYTGFELRIDNTAFSTFVLGGNGSWYSHTYSTPLQLNNWYLVNATWNGSISNLYINGLLVMSMSVPYFSNNNFPVLFGTRGDYWNGGWLNGTIDDIGIWNRALTQQEITALYQSCSNPLATITSPGSTAFCSGGSLNLTASTGIGYTYQWFRNGTAISNATASSYSATLAGNYTVVISSNGCSSTSAATTVTVNPNPTVALTGLNSFTNLYASPITLTGNPSGGTYTGTGVSNNLFNPSIPGLGVNSVNYSYTTAAGCSGNASQSTIVYDTLGVVCTTYDTITTLISVTDTLIINTTLSLPSPNNENTILIYPNPASDHITIDNGNFAAMAGYSIKIENNAGQQVFQSLINQAQFYVDLSTWTGNGLYFVHLIDSQNNTVTVRKIVLQ